MIQLILRIYDYMHTHILQCVAAFCAMTIALLLLILKLDFKEDISAFLPFEGKQYESFQVYQDVSGANKLIAIFQNKDTLNSSPDYLISAVDDFSETLEKNDSLEMVTDVVTQIDLEAFIEVTDYVYNNIPYFLTEADYIRMDSLLSQEEYVKDCLEEDKRLLMFPAASLLTSNIAKDPLNLFTPVVSKLNNNKIEGFFELYDGYIFTNDMQQCLLIMDSPFGNSETQKNTQLVHLLENIATDVEHRNTNVDIHFIGGPSIAVGNATQIKEDSIISVLIAAVLILTLMFVVFKDVRNIVFIAISILWGWCFALGALSLFRNDVSLIVIGISSIILGIAVNYPLHLITHSEHTSSIKQALREIISPLIIGNITTVGAFMALLPLESVALQDLGLFSSFLLIGTIVFVIMFLPHVLQKRNIINCTDGNEKHNWLERLSNITLENNKWVLLGVIVLTCLFAFYSNKASFDSDMSHINYMTDEQHNDMKYFQQVTSGINPDYQCLYVVSKGLTIDEALLNGYRIHTEIQEISKKYNGITIASCVDFLTSQFIQTDRIERWNTFVNKYSNVLTNELIAESGEIGFSTNAFEPFYSIIKNTYVPQDSDYFSPLYSMFSSNLSTDEDSGIYRVIDVMQVKNEDLQSVKNQVENLEDIDSFCFDVQGMNSALAINLSDNFNYLGWACGIIVFIFLWFSFGNIELAIMSFLPMAVSWIWILGIMGLTGIQFNIVNIILATFIFGQGDDYTIFMTEGCCYEYAYRRKMLASYKSSIIISALIMFIGIGTLILAKHPALRSLAEVTIVGMFSVVLMAYLLPPLVFKWMVTSRGYYRKRPLTIVPLFRTIFCGFIWLSQLMMGYMLGLILFVFGKRTKEKCAFFRKFVTLCHKFDLKVMPGLKFTLHNPHYERFDNPCIIVCNHQSMLDPMFLMAMTHKILIVANERSSMNPIVRIMFKWLGFYTIKNCNFTAWKDSSLERDLEIFKSYVNDGYSIAIFPEGVRNPESSIVRYHKGPFYLAEELGLDIVPIIMHGVNYMMPKGSFACYGGSVNMHIGKRIDSRDSLWGKDYSKTTKLIHKYYVNEYAKLKKEYETTSFFKSLLLDRYKYKGMEVMSTIRSNMKKFENYSKYIDRDILEETVFIKHSGYGEMALLFALVHPDKKIIAYEENYEKCELAKYAAKDLVNNILFLSKGEPIIVGIEKTLVYDWSTL